MSWIQRHFSAILYGWFFTGLAVSGLFAPSDRVAELNSDWVTQGWHLSMMALVFGSVTLGLYAWRMRPIHAD